MKDLHCKDVYYSKLISLKIKKATLEKEHERAWLKVIDAENNLNKRDEQLISIEKQIRSLAAKLSWAKKKNK